MKKPNFQQLQIMKQFSCVCNQNEIDYIVITGSKVENDYVGDIELSCDDNLLKFIKNALSDLKSTHPELFQKLQDEFKFSC